jgi:glutaminase
MTVTSATAAVDVTPAQQPLAVRRPGPVEGLLREVWADARTRADGQLATYIPQLALADPSTFGVAVTTLDGRTYSAGDIVPFTIQSVSKPYVYALALAAHGVEAVLGRIGAEPTGNAFNTISVDAQGRPFNPMVNAGAILTTSMVADDSTEAGFASVLDGLSAFAGRQLSVDEQVYASERETGDRNRAIAYLLASVGALPGDVERILAAYFRQCAVEVTACDLAVMAATLANGGVNPITRVRVVGPEVVSRVLTVMATCGMYDFAGEWLFRVGLPAKSGVSGGISAVHPGRIGIGAHSPLLDERGNSVRGIAFCEGLSSRLGMHLFGGPSAGAIGTIRSGRGGTLRSKRVRRAGEREVLDAEGHRIAVHGLPDGLDVTTAERLVRGVVDDPTRPDWHVFDLSRVRHVEKASVTLLTSLLAELRGDGAMTVLVYPRATTVRRAVNSVAAVCDTAQTDPDTALQWCEDSLLRAAGVADGPPDGLIAFAEQDLLLAVSPAAVAALEAAVETRLFPAGSQVFAEGAAADGLYFVGAGQVSAQLKVDGTVRRLSTMGPGSSFGEIALVEHGPRSMTIVADQPTLCYVLTAAALEDAISADPATGLEMYRAIARGLAERLRAATRELSSLDGQG